MQNKTFWPRCYGKIEYLTIYHMLSVEFLHHLQHEVLSPEPHCFLKSYLQCSLRDNLQRILYNFMMQSIFFWLLGFSFFIRKNRYNKNCLLSLKNKMEHEDMFLTYCVWCCTPPLSPCWRVQKCHPKVNGEEHQGLLSQLWRLDWALMWKVVQLCFLNLKFSWVYSWPQG